jgi:hypothetical protein
MGLLIYSQQNKRITLCYSSLLPSDQSIENLLIDYQTEFSFSSSSQYFACSDIDIQNGQPFILFVSILQFYISLKFS